MPRARYLLISLLAAAALCGSASAELVASLSLEYGLIDDGRTRYAYTVSNAAESEFPLDLFLLDIGEGVRPEFEMPAGWFVDFAPDEETYEVTFLAGDGAALAPGASAEFILLAAADPDILPYFIANFAESSNEGGYVFDFILSPEDPYALRPGDTNDDGLVDLVDLNNVRNNFAQSGDPVLGDTDPFDGIVDLYDLNQVRNNFGRDYNNSAIPEPGAMQLAMIGLLVSLALYGCERQ